MATTNIRLGKNFNSAVNYLTKGKPHNNDRYIQGNRALKISAVNAFANPKYFKKENDALLKSNPKVNKNSVKCIKTIISFDPKQLNYKKLKDREIALKIGIRVAKRKYPHNASLIVLQADNTHHILHDHILTNARRIDNGKSCSHLATFKKTVHFTNEAEKHFKQKPIKTHHYQNTHNTSMSVRKIKENGKYSYILDLHKRILKSCHNAKNLNQFFNNLHNNGISTKPLEKLQKGKYHYYNHPTNSGHYEKITDALIKNKYNYNANIAKNSNLKLHKGQYLRLKKHITYKFTDKTGKKRIVRDKKLGIDTSVNYILKSINHPNTHKYSIKSLRPTKSTKFTKFQTFHTSKLYSIQGIPKPTLNKPKNISQPIVKFHPKSHAVSKALNDFTYSLSRIRANTTKGSSQQKYKIEQAEENCEFKKQVAKKIEVNEENRNDFLKAVNESKLNMKAYFQNLKDYNKVKRIQEYQAHLNGPTI